MQHKLQPQRPVTSCSRKLGFHDLGQIAYSGPIAHLGQSPTARVIAVARASILGVAILLAPAILLTPTMAMSQEPTAEEPASKVPAGTVPQDATTLTQPAVEKTPGVQFALVVHGGAGKIAENPEYRAGREKALDEALRAGRAILEQDGRSLNAVTAAVMVLEDSPYFNAGRGACFNSIGKHELDASIMNGKTHACGGVTGVSTVKNPILLARAVMDETTHVLMGFEGAEAFADKVQETYNIRRVSNDYFHTDFQRQVLEELKQLETSQILPTTDISRMTGTVGAVALDKHGNLAAATSTGGRPNKLPGRIGDTPINNAGNYADNRSCACSGTGFGEDFIRYAVCYDVSARMRLKGETVEQAVHNVLNNPEQLVRGGVIAVDRQGNIAMEFNTPGMSRGALDSTGRWEIHVDK